MDRSDLKALILLLLIGVPLAAIGALNDWGPNASLAAATVTILIAGGLAWGVGPPSGRRPSR